jgi:hypothetical protein
VEKHEIIYGGRRYSKCSCGAWLKSSAEVIVKHEALPPFDPETYDPSEDPDAR